MNSGRSSTTASSAEWTLLMRTTKVTSCKTIHKPEILELYFINHCIEKVNAFSKDICNFESLKKVYKCGNLKHSLCLWDNGRDCDSRLNRTSWNVSFLVVRECIGICVLLYSSMSCGSGMRSDCTNWNLRISVTWIGFWLCLDGSSNHPPTHTTHTDTHTSLEWSHK